jgi:hypothetical protein
LVRSSRDSTKKNEISTTVGSIRRAAGVLLVDVASWSMKIRNPNRDDCRCVGAEFGSGGV